MSEPVSCVPLPCFRLTSTPVSPFFNDDIGPKAFVKLDTVKFNRNWNLAFNFQSGIRKRLRKKNLINRFKQSRTNFHMKTNGTINNYLSDFIFIHLCAFVSSCDIFPVSNSFIVRTSVPGQPRVPSAYRVQHLAHTTSGGGLCARKNCSSGSTRDQGWHMATLWRGRGECGVVRFWEQ